jgi:alpha-L-rhamnosidase
MPGNLTAAKAARECMYGEITCKWQRDPGKITLKITIPANTTDTVFVPATDAGQVTEGGKPAALAVAVQYLKMDGNSAVFRVGSGSYEFVSAVK